MAIESYKYKSKIATAISFFAAFVVYVGKDELAKLLPVEWAYLAPIIVLIAGYIATQSTENKRVDVAEQIIEEKYADVDPVTSNGVLNDEYVTGDDIDE